MFGRFELVFALGVLIVALEIKGFVGLVEQLVFGFRELGAGLDG